MAVRTFRRSLSLPTRKHATEGKPVELVPPLKQVVIPINQHFGAPNKNLVNAGDKVTRGQKIADAAALFVATALLSMAFMGFSGLVK